MTLPNINPIELSRWQGQVDEKFISLNDRMGNLETKVDALPDQIEKRMEKVMNGKPSGVTFKWVLEKVAMPFIVGGGSAGLTIYAILQAIQNGSLGGLP